MNDALEFIRSNKGGMKIIHRGYMYTVHKKRQGGGIRWRCTQRSLNCKGSISTGNGPPKVNMPHNHIPDPHSVALARCRQADEFSDITEFLEAECDEFFDDSVPLTQRIASTSSSMTPTNPVEQQLHSQPLSPTKLKVTRQATAKTPKFQPIAPKPTENITIPPASEEVCLRWNSHHNNMQTSFPYLLKREQFVDVTLVAEGQMIKCHRVILSSCSSYFEKILESIDHHQHPVIFLKDIPYWVLKSLTEFMYVGEVNIVQTKLQELLEAAEILKIKGLAGKSTTQNTTAHKTVSEIPKLFEKTSRPSHPPVLEPQVKPVPKPLIVKRVTDEDNRRTTTTPAYVKPAVLPLEQLPITDPLALLEPTYQEETRRQEELPAVVKQREHIKTIPKRTIGKKLRKRKGPEIDESHIPLRMRRGTRSRPNVKIPRYYHNFETPVESDPLIDTTSIKSEPIDEDFEPEVQARSPTPPPRTIRRIVRTAENNEDVLITGIEADRVMLMTNNVETSREKTIVPFVITSQAEETAKEKGLQDEDPDIIVEVEERTVSDDDDDDDDEGGILEIDERDQDGTIMEEKPTSDNQEDEHVLNEECEDGTRDAGIDIEETVVQNMDTSAKNDNKKQEEENKQIANLQITDIVSLNEEDNSKDVVDKVELLEEVVNKE
ncbi:uncharacterized protein LOC108743322 isoform X2 [Agrilus planipennis]|uniref:Uncharacterized protein LOC108743322 isoform X2 n=1 Tax=Agrilus planipennis TaxID=224129 RepID=A0A7F5RC16_AGRPL|nr:uncharacterized protein LOC108743322 isoform X2 [Agrilus planipennis]